MTQQNNTKPFWEVKSLSEMSPEEWEALCDGCGKCCLVLLEDDETGDIWETDVGCKLFDSSCRRCTDYDNRHAKVPGCVKLSPETISTLSWMPESCAYRTLAEGRPLPSWHPLISGTKESVVTAGIAVPDSLHHEQDVPARDLQDHVTKQR
jgi:hypothetical protein